jgi:cytochrome b561
MLRAKRRRNERRNCGGSMSSNLGAVSHYSRFSRIVHWLTVLLMAGMFYTGFTHFGGPPRGMGGPPGGPPGMTMAMRAAPNLPPGAAGPAAFPGGPPGGFPAGFPGGRMPPPETPFSEISLHKAMGFTILLLALARLVYRVFGKVPALPAGMPVWQAWIARGVQGLIYVGIVVQPLTGWLGSGFSFSYFGLFTMPPVRFLSGSLGPTLRFMHNNGAWVLVWLICLHALGALYHHYIRKDNVLLSMIRA